MKLNQKYADLHADTDVSVPYINVAGQSLRLEISDPRKTSVNDKKAAFDGKFDIYINPLTHTPQSEIDVETEYVVLEKEMHGVNNMLKHNMDITLTGADFTALHIHQDAPHRHVVPPTTFAPNNMGTKQSRLVNRFFTFNPTDGHQSDKFKPEGVAKVGRKLAITNIGDPEPSDDKYKEMASIGAVEYNIVSQPEDSGRQGWLITWYISPTGVVGPPSPPLKFTIL